MDNSNRAAFEAWYGSTRSEYEGSEQSSYDDCWGAWQAALSRSQDAPRCQCCGYLVTESEHRGCLRSAERSQDVARVAEGWMLVPTKSTPEMREAFKRAYQDGSIWTERIDYALEQFIEAAPQPPQAGASDDGAAPWPECKHRVCHKNGACWDAGKCLDPAARAAPIVAMRPVDASQNGGMVVLHFRSAQDANRFRSCASMNIGVAQNITAPAPAEPKQYTDLIHRLQYGKPFTRIEILDALLALGAFPGAPNSEQRAATCPRCKSTTAQGCNDMNCGYVESEQRAATLSDEQRLSLTSPLTPYGLLVRALRIVAGTTLYDMSKALLTTPAKLSAMEFGRTPVTQEFAFDVSAYFDALGIPDTLAALKAALLSTLNGDKHE